MGMPPYLRKNMKTLNESENSKNYFGGFKYLQLSVWYLSPDANPGTVSESWSPIQSNCSGVQELMVSRNHTAKSGGGFRNLEPCQV